MTCTAVIKCSTCNETVISENGQVTSAVTKEPTCTEKGTRTFTAAFADGSFTAQTKDVDVDALGHTYGKLAYTWSEDYSGCTATNRCEKCDDLAETETAIATSKITQEQSCTKPQITTYTAAFTSQTFATQTKNVQTQAEAGHKPGEWITDREPTLTAQGSKHKACTVCGVTVETADIEKLTPIVYTVTEGANGKYTKQKDTTYTLRADGAFSKFVSVELDGVTVDSRNYTAQSGSTIVTFTKAYLGILPVGEHTVRLNYTDGYAQTTLTIARSANRTVGGNPATGDESHVTLWLAIGLCSAGGLAWLGLRKKRVS